MSWLSHFLRNTARKAEETIRKVADDIEEAVEDGWEEAVDALEGIAEEAFETMEKVLVANIAMAIIEVLSKKPPETNGVNKNQRIDLYTAAVMDKIEREKGVTLKKEDQKKVRNLVKEHYNSLRRPVGGGGGNGEMLR